MCSATLTPAIHRRDTCCTQLKAFLGMKEGIKVRVHACVCEDVIGRVIGRVCEDVIRRVFVRVGEFQA